MVSFPNALLFFSVGGFNLIKLRIGLSIQNIYLTEAISLDLTYIGLTLLILHLDVRIMQNFHFLISTWKKKTYKIYNVYQDSSLIKKLVEYDIPEANMSLYRPPDYTFSLCSIQSTYYLKILINEIKL
jgi:hypothetical protein